MMSATITLDPHKKKDAEVENRTPQNKIGGHAKDIPQHD